MFEPVTITSNVSKRVARGVGVMSLVNPAKKAATEDQRDRWLGFRHARQSEPANTLMNLQLLLQSGDAVGRKPD